MQIESQSVRCKLVRCKVPKETSNPCPLLRRKETEEKRLKGPNIQIKVGFSVRALPPEKAEQPLRACRTVSVGQGLVATDVGWSWNFSQLVVSFNCSVALLTEPFQHPFRDCERREGRLFSFCTGAYASLYGNKGVIVHSTVWLISFIRQHKQLSEWGIGQRPLEQCQSD